MTPLQVGLLLACVGGLAVGQLCFKLSAHALTDATGAASMLRLVYNPWFLGALATYGGATLLWIWILREVSLSKAYPFFALSFVLVPLMGLAFLGETTTTTYWVGIGLIVAGIYVTTL
ncbi:MAG: EamA family transporter [Leptospirillia bacterium]